VRQPLVERLDGRRLARAVGAHDGDHRASRRELLARRLVGHKATDDAQPATPHLEANVGAARAPRARLELCDEPRRDPDAMPPACIGIHQALAAGERLTIDERQAALE